ncbi:MAG: porin, partial [Labilithrix sp.]|nr:porin [Labilithrix sp.]
MNVLLRTCCAVAALGVATPALAQDAPRTAPPPAQHGIVTPPYAPQLVPPGPAERDVARVEAAAKNVVGVTTEWGAGLPVFHSADGIFNFKPIGRILSDVSTTFGSRYRERNVTTTGMRALGLGLEGGVGTNFFYQFECDFSESEVDVVTAFLGWRSRLAGRVNYDVRAGHLFNDRGFEGSTGSDSTPFLERSVVATAITPQRGFDGIGLMGRLFGPGWHGSLTVTGDRVDGDQTTSDSRTALARFHVNPLKSTGSILHLGAWGFDEALSSTAGTLSRNTAMGGRFNGAVRVYTGELTGGTGTTGYGVELGGYVGPVWLMGETGRRHARLDSGRPDFTSTSLSISGGWFVSGDLPPYNPRLGSFGQPKVLRPIFTGGPGAIELTARYENLDYTDLLTGGEGWAATLGVNWYLNSFTRIQLNRIYWFTDNRTGTFIGRDTGQTIGARVA